MNLFNGPKYTEQELMTRLKVFIGVCLALTLFGIVFVVLYSLIFVVQPLDAISPIDQKFFELIIPIATFLTGTLSGIMLAGNDKEAQMKALEAATRPPPPSAPLKKTDPVGSFSPGASTTMKPAAAAPVAAAAPIVNLNTPDDDDDGEVIVGFGGKPAPPPAKQPEI